MFSSWLNPTECKNEMLFSFTAAKEFQRYFKKSKTIFESQCHQGFFVIWLASYWHSPFSPSLKLPPCGLEGQCGAVRPQTRNTHVVKLLWTGILIKKARKTAGWSLFSKEMQQSVLCSVFSSASLFCPFSLCPDRTQILITWWDYISRPCVCNRACGFSYNLHEPL